MKDSEFDFYRWLGYGLGLLLLAVAAVFAPVMIWAFVILLGVALVDIGYCNYFKYRFVTKSSKNVNINKNYNKIVMHNKK
ncbi:MAG: hypothetical protein V1839_03495 [archaeon]